VNVGNKDHKDYKGSQDLLAQVALQARKDNVVFLDRKVTRVILDSRVYLDSRVLKVWLD